MDRDEEEWINDGEEGLNEKLIEIGSVSDVDTYKRLYAYINNIMNNEVTESGTNVLINMIK